MNMAIHHFQMKSYFQLPAVHTLQCLVKRLIKHYEQHAWLQEWKGLAPTASGDQWHSQQSSWAYHYMLYRELLVTRA